MRAGNGAAVWKNLAPLGAEVEVEVRRDARADHLKTHF